MSDRLFVVKDNSGDIIAKYYRYKRDAKAYRNEHGPNGKFHISLGPDHWRFSETKKPNSVKKKRNRNRK